jgi:large subunit ribosomal protein L17e
MPSYSQEPEDPQRAAKARGSHLRVHFVHCREVCHAIKGMQLGKAKSFLQAVLEYKQAVPFTKFTGGCGRHAQGKLRGSAGDKCKWPQKATKIILDLVKNAEANAEVKGLDTDKLYISHTQANLAIKQRRRTYRAHGRIGPYMASPAHIELVLTEKRENVQKGEETKKPLKVSRKRQAQLRLKSGGGVPAN